MARADVTFHKAYRDQDGRRVVRCLYEPRNNDVFPMGRARTRCPRCGAEVAGHQYAPDLERIRTT